MEANFGPYRLLEPIGQGGMGQVFRAYDTVHDREVALKVLAPDVAQDPSFEQRFRREAHVAARMSEPHVVPIHSYGEIDGRLYVDMRLIAGRDLASVLGESGALDPVRAVGIIEQVADALDAAHAISLVHRDIKPSNILLGRRDFVYLIDFGIAQDVNATRLTRTGAAIGTFAYMAPERLDSGQSGPSSDIYSLACVLYECLTGQLPFPGDSLQQQIAGHLAKPPPRPSAAGVPPAFDEIIARGLAKEPGQRYPTVTALAEASREALERLREVPPPTMPTQFTDTRQAAPLPSPALSPPGPRPSVPGPAHADPAPWGPPRVADPAPLKATSRAEQSERPANFVIPGALLVLFAVINMIFAIWKTERHQEGLTYFARDFTATLVIFVYIFLWVGLAVAFALVARKCWTADRRVAITAALTSVAAVLGALPWAAVLDQHNNAPGFVKHFTLIVFGAFIACGIIVYRPFGWWWSVPTTVAGLLGIAMYLYLPPIYGAYIQVSTGVYQYVLWRGSTVSTLQIAIWVVPLFILGIAMCRTRARPPS